MLATLLSQLVHKMGRVCDLDKIVHVSFVLFNWIGIREDMVKRRTLRVHGRGATMLLSAYRT